MGKEIALRPLVEDGEAVDDRALATAASRASVTGRPALLVPSPETSMMRRSAVTPLRASCAMAKSMPAPIAVRPVKERGAVVSFAANSAAVSPSLMMSNPPPPPARQARTIRRSTGLSRDRCRPGRGQHTRIRDSLGIAFALKLKLAGIDAARHVGREDERDVHRFGPRRAGQEKDHAGKRRHT